MAYVMKNSVRMMAAVEVLLIATASYSQAPAPSFSLKLNVSPTSAQTGSKFLVVVDFTNNLHEQIVMDVCLSRDAYCNFAIYVRDSRGDSLPGPKPLTILETALLGIAPGETRKFSSDLSHLFDLSRPDRYEIQVERLDPYTKKSVRSNVSHIIVSAQSLDGKD
jgi:hypothetical protein